MNLWFTEQEQDHLRVSFKTEAVLFRGRSEFQSVDVIETAAYGRMLILDGCVMVTDADEFAYHELIAHVPLLLHANPRHVVVIGGGDGGTVRELLKHKSVERIELCEIDAMVLETSRRFFPSLAAGLDDPRVLVRVGDGVAYMRELSQVADVVIIDSTDPIGPGEGLFSGAFYRSVAAALRPNGLMVAQSESPWYAPKILGRIHRNVGQGFAHLHPYVGAVPTYPRGFWSWTLAANHGVKFGQVDRARFAALEPSLKYVTYGLLSSAFDLPPFFRGKLTASQDAEQG